MINSFRNILLTLGLLTGVLPVSAQRKAALPDIPASGFYNITLTPEVIAASKGNDLADIRIFQGAMEVPYVLRKETDGFDPSSFKGFEVVENKQVPGGVSTFTFRNTLRLEHFELLIKNSWVQKQFTLRGSNDNKTWYALTQSALLDLAAASPDSSGTALIKTIYLPPVNYTYLQMLINDSADAPLNILGVGQYAVVPKTASYLPLPAPVITTHQIKSQHSTRVILDFKNTYIIDKLSFNITAPAFYHRELVLRQPDNYQQFTLSSDQPAQLLPETPLRTSRLELHIENGNNPPLEITAVTAFQANTYLTTYLEKGKQYSLEIGDSTLSSPDYDLSYFTANLGGNIPSLTSGKLSECKSTGTVVTTGTVFNTKVWVWVGIAGIIVLIGFLAFRMINDMQKDNKK